MCLVRVRKVPYHLEARLDGLTPPDAPHLTPHAPHTITSHTTHHHISHYTPHTSPHLTPHCTHHRTPLISHHTPHTAHTTTSHASHIIRQRRVGELPYDLEAHLDGLVGATVAEAQVGLPHQRQQCRVQAGAAPPTATPPPQLVPGGGRVLRYNGEWQHRLVTSNLQLTLFTSTKHHHNQHHHPSPNAGIPRPLHIAHPK